MPTKISTSPSPAPLRAGLAACVSALALSAGAPMLAFAQEPAATRSGVQDVITVTARKREESLQDVPLSVSAFSAADLAAAGLESLEDIAEVTPGLYFGGGSNRAGVNGVSFRGMDNNNLDATLRNNSVFVDGLYYAGFFQTVDFDDFERVEVIRGPQSAYFGRNTFGGAINYVTKDPTNEFAARTRVLGAENGKLETNFSVSGPIVEDKLFFRLFGSYRTFDGAWDNGNGGQDLGARQDTTFSAVIDARPTDGVELRARVLYNDYSDSFGPVFMAGIDDYNGEIGPNFIPAIIGDLPDNRVPQLNLEVGPNAPDGYGLTGESVFFTAQADIDVLDGHTLTFAGHFHDEENAEINEADAIATPLLPFILGFGTYNLDNFEDYSLEARLTSPGDRRMRWTAGLYYFDQEYGESNNFISIAPGGALGDNPLPTELGEVRTVQNSAVFGAIEYDFSPQFTVSVEGRYQEDVTTSDDPRNATPALEETTRAFLPRFIADYDLSEDVMLYVNVAKGNKPANLNSNIAALTPTQQAAAAAQGVGVFTDEEVLWNYEGGVKTTLADGALRLNVSAFLLDWNDRQSRTTIFLDLNGDGDTTDPGELLSPNANVGSSTHVGLEVETAWQITDALSLGGTLAWVNAEYDDFEDVDLLEVFGDPQAEGQKTPLSPEWTGSVFATYTAPLTSRFDLVVRGDANYIDERFMTPLNVTTIPDRWRANLRAGVESERLSVTAYVTNLFDDDTIQDSSTFVDLRTFFVPIVNSQGTALRNRNGFFSTNSEPRQFGVVATYDF